MVIAVLLNYLMLRDLPNIEALEDAGLLSGHAAHEEIAASQSGDAEVDEESSFIE